MYEEIERFFVKDKNAFFYSYKLNKDCGKTVHNNNRERFDLAQKEYLKPTVEPEKIVEHVNDFFEMVGLNKIDCEEAKMSPTQINYKEIKRQFNLDDERDIIWMKFTKSGHLGVVATSNDVGYDIPSDSSEYDIKEKVYNEYKRKYEDVWKFTSSGILVHSIGQEWDESFVLVFPLVKLSESCGYNRHKMEVAIGNYLISKNIPIIDYYSHNY